MHPFEHVSTIDALERRHGKNLIRFGSCDYGIARFGVRGWPDEIIFGCTECGNLYPSGINPEKGCPHCGLNVNQREVVRENIMTSTVREFLDDLYHADKSIAASVERAITALVGEMTKQVAA